MSDAADHVGSPARPPFDEARLAWGLVLPAIAVIVLIGLGPIVWAIWESLHLDDLRMPWLGRRFIGPANYVEAFRSARFWGALAHTLAFAGVSVALELVAGVAIAVAVESVTRWRGLVRTAMLLPWAVPTVVVALVWRFMFETPAGLVNSVLVRTGATTNPPTWFADATAAWLPLVLADVWKTAPFVAILVLAGLQSIDRSLYEAARIDGAGAWRQFTEVTIPLIRPALVVALIFRVLDAFRVFDLIYVMTAGGPGTATEPLALYTFSALLMNLRFGFGSALSVIVFAITFLFALAAVRFLGRDALLGEPT